MTKEERLRFGDMGNYYQVSADNRDLNYDQHFVKRQVETVIKNVVSTTEVCNKNR